MNERIKALRKHYKLNQADFAAKLGITQASISRIESGEIIPANSTVALICRTFGCDELWLRTGEGEMFRPMSDTEALSDLLGTLIATGTPEEVRFLTLLIRISHENWPLIEQYLRDYQG